MKLLNDLIDTLSSEEPNLTDALMKTKVLLHRIGRKDLTEWVNQELSGYPETATLPEYRMLHASVHGNMQNVAWQFTDHPLPTLHLKPEVRKRFEEADLRDSIAAVEKLAEGKKGTLRRQLPPEAYHLFEKVLTPGSHVTSAWCEIGYAAVTNVVTQVRSRLLDFLLDLQGKVGEGMSEEEVKKVAQSPETATAFNQTIYGNNNTILVGNHNTQTVVHHVNAGDFASLAKVLKDHGVDQADIHELQGAIADDAKDEQEKKKPGFGTRVKQWIGGMMSKAANASWTIELGMAGKLLTDALKRYYDL